MLRRGDFLFVTLAPCFTFLCLGTLELNFFRKHFNLYTPNQFDKLMLCYGEMWPLRFRRTYLSVVVLLDLGKSIPKMRHFFLASLITSARTAIPIIQLSSALFCLLVWCISCVEVTQIACLSRPFPIRNSTLKSAVVHYVTSSRLHGSDYWWGCESA